MLGWDGDGDEFHWGSFQFGWVAGCLALFAMFWAVGLF